MNEYEARAKEVYFQITIVDKDKKVSNEIDYILYGMDKPKTHKFCTQQEMDKFSKILEAEGVRFYANKVITF